MAISLTASLPQETIVNQLEQRYINGIIYTYIGDILVAINPFVDLGIYSDKVGNSCDFRLPGRY